MDSSLRKKPKVSIVIPTYNRSHLIESAIESALSLKYPNFEVIIIDDNSKDNTEEVVKNIKDARINYIKHDEQRGAPKSKADGIKNSTGEYILFGEDDVLYDVDYINKLILCMEKNNAAIVAGRIIYMIENESKKDALERWNKVKKPLIDMNYIIGNFSININEDMEVPFVHALFFTRKIIFDKISYDENYRGNAFREETDPQISALKHGLKIVFCPDAVCYHLPRIKTIGGGQHHMSKYSYLYWTIKNNNYFLKKHYSFLKEKYELKHSKEYMMLLFACQKIILRVLSELYQIRPKILRNLFEIKKW